MEMETAQENLLKKREALGIVVQEKTNQPILSTLNAMVEKFAVCYRHSGEKLPCAKCEADLQNYRDSQAEGRKIAEEQAEREKQKRLQYIKDNPDQTLIVCGVGRRYLSCSLDGFKGAEKVKAVCRTIIEKPESIVLTGDTGSGKTHLAVAILRELITSGKVVSSKGGKFTTVPDLLLSIRSGFGNSSGFTQSEEDFVNEYAKTPFLILDDLGAEKSTEWATATLSAIIDKRYRELLPTIYTTNLTLDEIGNQLSRRISSRMSDAKIIKLSLPDYRRKRA
jgi:DNA replication protein DnaC